MIDSHESTPQVILVPEEIAGQLSELEPGSEAAERVRVSLIASSLGNLANKQVFGVYQQGEDFGYINLSANNLGDKVRPEVAEQQGLSDPAEAYTKLTAKSNEGNQNEINQPSSWLQHNKVDLREKGPFSKAERETMHNISWALGQEMAGNSAKRNDLLVNLNKQFENKQISERFYAMALSYMKVARAGRAMALTREVSDVDKSLKDSAVLGEDEKARINMISSFVGGDRHDRKSESEISQWLFEKTEIPKILADPTTSETYRASLIGALAAVGDQASIKGQAVLDRYLKTGHYEKMTVINAQ